MENPSCMYEIFIPRPIRFCEGVNFLGIELIVPEKDGDASFAWNTREFSDYISIELGTFRKDGGGFILNAY